MVGRFCANAVLSQWFAISDPTLERGDVVDDPIVSVDGLIGRRGNGETLRRNVPLTGRIRLFLLLKLIVRCASGTYGSRSSRGPGRLRSQDFTLIGAE